MTLVAFAVCLLGFVLVGLASVRKAKGSNTDYYLASSSVRPWVAALSAVATNNSGFLFIGVIGYTFAVGMAAAWMMIAWILGDFLTSLFVHRRLRQETEATGGASFASVVSKWGGSDFRIWRRIAALVTILFLGTYAAAQISAGGKALQVMLNWTPEAGAIISAILILAYSAVGGIRASIWTDAAQSIVMVFALALLVIVTLVEVGGLGSAGAQLAELPGFMSLFPTDLSIPGFLGAMLFALGWGAAGVGTIGQPHIMIRFMAMERADQINRVRFWYYGFFIAFYTLAISLGLLARIQMPDLMSGDTELALPLMAVELLPSVLVGVILAGVFAATMSTADSLVLSCSASITHDLSAKHLDRPWMMKLATAAVTVSALLFALFGASSVFSLVLGAWSMLACAFAPLMMLLAMQRRVSEWAAIGMMVAGVGVAVLWTRAGPVDVINEALPGIAIPFVLGLLLSRPAPATSPGREAQSAAARQAAE